MIVACVHPRALHHISVHAAGSKAALRLKKFMFEATNSADAVHIGAVVRFAKYLRIV
jgi:hypothetical protein